MISAVDIRYASSDAYFSIREVSLGMAADVGTLQRLPKIVGNDSLVRELAFTGRNMPAQEAKEVKGAFIYDVLINFLFSVRSNKQHIRLAGSCGSRSN